MDILKKLQLLPEFSSFTESELETLSKAFVVQTCPDQYEFIREGEKGDTLFILLKGMVQVSRQPYIDTRREYVERLCSGALFGLISLIDHGRRAATCSAEGAVTVASLPRSAFDLLCNANAGIAQHFQFIIASQLAKDMRVYNKAMRQLIANDDKAGFYGTLKAASFEYRGIERRKLERRISVERRKKASYWDEVAEV